MSTSQRVKYPRTPHLPWSPGRSADDIAHHDAWSLQGKHVIVTEKMDGENTTMYNDHIHARSIDSRHHPSRSWVKQLHQRISYNIPEGWRVCGENLYARHSIAYNELPSYFMMFSIWNDANQCLSWEETLEWAALLELQVPPVLYEGPWNTELIAQLPYCTETTEGYVVRNADAFAYHDFADNVAKCVRAQHVQTTEHWMHQEVIPNQLHAQAQNPSSLKTNDTSSNPTPKE